MVKVAVVIAESRDSDDLTADGCLRCDQEVGDALAAQLRARLMHKVLIVDVDDVFYQLFLLLGCL
jgi:hypothetical protein